MGLELWDDVLDSLEVHNFVQACPHSFKFEKRQEFHVFSKIEIPIHGLEEHDYWPFHSLLSCLLTPLYKYQALASISHAETTPKKSHEIAKKRKVGEIQKHGSSFPQSKQMIPIHSGRFLKVIANYLGHYYLGLV